MTPLLDIIDTLPTWWTPLLALLAVAVVVLTYVALGRDGNTSPLCDSCLAKMPRAVREPKRKGKRA